MSDYNFVPDYPAWWKKRDLSKEQLCWLALGINPDDMQRQGKPDMPNGEYSPEYVRWLGEFRYYCDCLPSYLQLSEKHQRLIAFVDIGKNKNDFIKNLYGYAHDFPKVFSDFLLNLKPCPLPNNFDKYKDIEQYGIREINLNKMNDEFLAFASIIPSNGQFFEKYFHLEDKRKNYDVGMDWYNNLLPEERHFYKRYTAYLSKILGSFSGYTGGLFFKTFESIVKSKYWNGNYREYIQKLYDEGYVFSDAVMGFLKNAGIDLTYSDNSWAIKFYQRWIDKGLWTLDDAILLYLGSDPNNDREFIGMASAPFYKEGYSLISPSQMAYLLNENEMENAPLYKFERDSSPSIFFEKHILAGNLQAIEKNGTYLFKPQEITIFIEKYFPNNHKPLALFQALGIDDVLKTVKSTIKSEKDFEAYLTEEMRNHKNSPNAKEHYKQKAINDYSLSTRAFTRAWGNAVKTSGNTGWSKAGRKKSIH